MQDHPIVGASWEGFAVETLIDCAPSEATATYYRSHAGAEIDLVLDFPNGEVWAIEAKRSLVPRIERGFHAACEDIAPTRRLVVYGGDETVPLPHGVVAMGLRKLARELADRA